MDIFKFTQMQIINLFFLKIPKSCGEDELKGVGPFEEFS